jgi:hypothetical protein
VKNLEEKFAEIEKRVKALVSENRAQKKRIRELEKDLNLTRHDAKQSDLFQEKQLQLRERVEKILKDLEAVEVRED